MVWCIKKGAIEDIGIVGGLLLTQFIYAGNSVFQSHLMSVGFTPSTIVICSTFATFLLTSPFALYFERKKWPRELSPKLLIQFFLVSFAGVTLFQSSFLKGINLTSPALGTAMLNLAPGLVFVVAWAARLEKVKLKCVYSKLKIFGTLLCVVGALLMSLVHSNEPTKDAHLLLPSLTVIFDKQKISGCLYLMLAVVILSSNVVLQACTLGDFPAPMSLCAITSIIGVFITAIVQWSQDPYAGITLPLMPLTDLISYSLLSGIFGGASVSFNGWAMKKRGPVLVSMFSPIGTVISVVLSVTTLGEIIRLGSIAGMVLMFAGLYFVLWAKGKEGYLNELGIESEFDAEKPLLS